jgi:hypothetical protein
MLSFIGALASPLNTILERVIPDPEARSKAQLELLAMQTNGELDKVNTQLQAIVSESKSSDPWTSRARPSFMYVIYTLILFSIPYGVLYAFNPTLAMGIAAGAKAWFNAIPEGLYQLFGIGYLGYSGARTVDKWKGSK